jgi:imidazoleglycerol-phosphate dehydratase
LIEEFFRALTGAAGMNLHLTQLAGRNTHHIVEAAFKAFARALGQAVSISGRTKGVPSTKGVL